MAVKFQLVIDCTDPGRLCSFWTAALGYELEPVPAGFATWDDYWRDVGVPEEELGGGPDRIRDPDGAGPAIWFQVVPEGKTIKNRLHIDLDPDDQAAEVARILALGAQPAGVGQGDAPWVVLADPEGNEFCVLQPHNSLID